MKYLFVLTLLTLSACSAIPVQNSNTIVVAPKDFAQIAPEPKATPKTWDGFTPDASLTPGATLDVTAKDVCVRGYSKKVRNVADAEKNQVYAEYGITARKPGEYEVDHLISLELGGSNDIKNLWPQSYITKPWNAHAKDKLENKLHAEACANHITLEEAQKEIRGDWRIAYVKYFGQPK